MSKKLSFVVQHKIAGYSGTGQSHIRVKVFHDDHVELW